MLKSERETLIVWTDEDEMITISTTQKPVMTKLLKNPNFQLTNEIKENGKRVGVDGFLPKWSISILQKKRKGRKDAFVSAKKRENVKK